MTSSHSFHSLEAEKEPISFNFGHIHTGMIGTKSPPPPGNRPGNTAISVSPLFSGKLEMAPGRYLNSYNKAGGHISIFKFGNCQIFTEIWAFFSNLESTATFGKTLTLKSILHKFD